MKKFTVICNKSAIIKEGPLTWEFEGDDIEVRDEYHSMEELYDHRMALNIALFHAIYNDEYTEVVVCKSKLHNDGTMFEGYFIVMARGLFGQISYHYKLEHWDKFDIPERERAWPYDGHTSQDVIERLKKL